ncbi:MAG: hypothetical protein ACLSA6_05975 [Holdemania massiliensis]
MEIAIVIVNLILLFYFTRMALHSRQVQVAGKLGPTWIITVFFIVIGIIRLFQDHSVFSIVQTVLIVLLGCCTVRCAVDSAAGDCLAWQSLYLGQNYAGRCY